MYDFLFEGMDQATLGQFRAQAFTGPLAPGRATAASAIGPQVTATARPVTDIIATAPLNPALLPRGPVVRFPRAEQVVPRPSVTPQFCRVEVWKDGVLIASGVVGLAQFSRAQEIAGIIAGEPHGWTQQGFPVPGAGGGMPACRIDLSGQPQSVLDAVIVALGLPMSLYGTPEQGDVGQVRAQAFGREVVPQYRDELPASCAANPQLLPPRGYYKGSLPASFERFRRYFDAMYYWTERDPSWLSWRMIRTGEWYSSNVRGFEAEVRCPRLGQSGGGEYVASRTFTTETDLGPAATLADIYLVPGESGEKVRLSTAEFQTRKWAVDQVLIACCRSYEIETSCQPGSVRWRNPATGRDECFGCAPPLEIRYDASGKPYCWRRPALQTPPPRRVPFPVQRPTPVTAIPARPLLPFRGQTLRGFDYAPWDPTL